MQPLNQDDDVRRAKQSGGESNMERAQETPPSTPPTRPRPKHRAGWLILLEAVAALLLGVLLLALLTLPVVSAFEVVTLIGAYWLIGGLLTLLSGFSRRTEARWAWSLAVGVVSIIAGLLALYHLIPLTSILLVAVLGLALGGMDIVRRYRGEDASAVVFGFLNVLLAFGLLLMALNPIALWVIALGVGGLVAGIIAVILSLRASPSPSEDLRVWIPILLLGISLFLCFGILILDIDIIERETPTTTVVVETVPVPQTVISERTVIVPQTVSSKETVIIPQPVTVEVVKYVTATFAVTVPQTIIVPQKVVQTVPVTQTVVVTPPACVPPAAATLPPGTAEFLSNGRFENGFGVDGVPSGWFAFDNGGERVAYSHHDDTWTPVEIDCNSALTEIDTRRFSDTVEDRFAGIGQTMSGLQPGAQYQFTMVGEIRTSDGDSHTDDQSYYVEWGIDPNGGNDWNAVTTWNRVPWNHVYYRSSPMALSACAPCRYAVSITVPSSKVTLFIRLYKRWAIPALELLLNLDNVSWVGPR